jgi:four helix bundle protein
MADDSFESLLVWQKAMDLVVKVYRLSQQGQLSRDWGMRDQLQRAVVSVPANISEGYERAGRKEYIHFLYNRQGVIRRTPLLAHCCHASKVSLRSRFERRHQRCPGSIENAQGTY